MRELLHAVAVHIQSNDCGELPEFNRGRQATSPDTSRVTGDGETRMVSTR